MKIDCSITENYFKEKARMTSKIDFKDNCNKLELHDPKKAIEIVQKWSDEHEQKTWKDKLEECLPNSERIILMNMFKPSCFFGKTADGKEWEEVCLDN